MKTKILLLLFLCSFILFSIDAQTNIFPSTGAAGIGTTTPDASSLLEIRSTKKGMLIPRMSKNQRDAIPTPATGLLIYQTNSTPGFYYYDGSAWKPVTPKNASTSLSNLTTTAVDSSLIPGINNSISLGSSSLRWKDVNLYNLKFSNGTIQTTAFMPYSAGTGLSLSGTTFTNTAPDKTVALTAGTGISVTGTYPNFTITNSASGNSWSLTGNANTDSSINFIGTTDAHPLVFRIKNVKSGIIDSTYQNTSLGYASLFSNSTGNSNTAEGYHTLYANTTGHDNTATGGSVLFKNTTGSNNTAVGAGALYNNLTGSSNVALGKFALYSNTNANSLVAIGDSALFKNTGTNTAIGSYALQNNTTAGNNTANGYEALYQNITGTDNTAIGLGALTFNTIGISNTANGSRALYSNIDGNYNTANGYYAMYYNAHGIGNTATGAYSLYSNNASGNSAYGYSSMYHNTSGSGNTAVGDSSMYNNTTGGDNTAGGNYALYMNTTGYSNTAAGFNTMYSNTTGSFNTATGVYALDFNTTGSQNTANGYEALDANSTGNENNAFGYGALRFNTTGSGNSGFGKYALSGNTKGAANTGLGNYSLYYNSTGYSNTATGNYALFSNNIGFENVAMGDSALYSNTAGSSNTGVGFQSLYSNVNGINNTATGSGALYSVITGANNSAFGMNALVQNNASNNTAIGSFALYYNTSGTDNTGVGYNAMQKNNGSQNTAIGSGALFTDALGAEVASGNTASGYQSLYDNHQANYNTGMGKAALFSNAFGNNNTAVGAFALTSATADGNIGVGYDADVQSGLTNSIVLGTGIAAGASNIAIIGNSATDHVDGPIYITTSDGRFKKNITEKVPGLDFINLLRPVTFQYKSDELQKQHAGKDSLMLAVANKLDYKEAESKVHVGFIAQEVEKIIDEKGYNINIVKKPANAQDNYGLSYMEFIAPMVKGMQQLSDQNDSLKNTNAILQSQLRNQQSEIDQLRAIVLTIQQKQEQCSPCGAGTVGINETQSYAIITDGSSLQQNIPNPFTNTTTIGYSLPQKFANAQIVITDKSGKTLKAINISGTGKGNIIVNASTLSSGAYQYSLVVDGRLIDTKQMMLAK